MQEDMNQDQNQQEIIRLEKTQQDQKGKKFEEITNLSSSYQNKQINQGQLKITKQGSDSKPKNQKINSFSIQKDLRRKTVFQSKSLHGLSQLVNNIGEGIKKKLKITKSERRLDLDKKISENHQISKTSYYQKSMLNIKKNKTEIPQQMIPKKEFVRILRENQIIQNDSTISEVFKQQVFQKSFADALRSQMETSKDNEQGLIVSSRLGNSSSNMTKTAHEGIGYFSLHNWQKINERKKNKPNSLMNRLIKRKAGLQEVPEILIDQTNMLKRNKSILSKFISPPKDLEVLTQNTLFAQRYQDKDIITPGLPSSLAINPEGRSPPFSSADKYHGISPLIKSQINEQSDNSASESIASQKIKKRESLSIEGQASPRIRRASTLHLDFVPNHVKQEQNQNNLVELKLFQNNFLDQGKFLKILPEKQKSPSIKQQISNFFQPLSPTLTQNFTCNEFPDSSKFSPQALHAAIQQQETDLINLKAKSSFSFLKLFTQNKDKEDEQNQEEIKIKNLQNLIPNYDEDIQLSDQSKEQEYLEDLIDEQQNLRRVRTKDSFGVLHPEGYLRAFWDLIIFFCVVYQGITTPMKLAFDYYQSYDVLKMELSIDILFIFDVILNFNTGVERGRNIIMDRNNIAIEYFKFWFWLDLLSSSPYTWFLAWSQGIAILDIYSEDTSAILKDEGRQLVAIDGLSIINNSQSGSQTSSPTQLFRLIRIVKILKLLKLLRLVKIRKMLLKIEENIVSDQMNLCVTFSKMFFQLAILGHYLACSFYAVGNSEFQDYGYAWLSDDVFNSGKQYIVNYSFGSKYLNCLYWSFTTMVGVGYGDIIPVTMHERIFVIFAMLVSSLIFAYIVNRIGNYVSAYNRVVEAYREKMLYVQQYVQEKEIPLDCQIKIRRYLDFVFETKKEIKLTDFEVYTILNDNLTNKIQMYIRGRTLKKIIILEKFGLDFISELAIYFERATYVVDDFLFVENDKAEFIYYIESGKIAMIQKQSYTFITDLVGGSYFGEYGVIMNKPRCLSAKSRDFTDVLTIQKKHFNRICDNYIESLRTLKFIRNSLEQENFIPLQIQCYKCSSSNHLVLQCDKFQKIKGNLMKIYSKQKLNQNNLFQNILKNRCKKKKQSKVKEQKLLRKNSKEKEEASDDEQQESIQDGRSQFFYENEQFQNIQYPSMESDDAFELKKQLISYVLPEKVYFINDSLLIEKILEYPYEAAVEVEEIKVNLRDKMIKLSNTPKIKHSKQINTFSDAVQKINKNNKFTTEWRNQFKNKTKGQQDGGFLDDVSKFKQGPQQYKPIDGENQELIQLQKQVNDLLLINTPQIKQEFNYNQFYKQITQEEIQKTVQNYSPQKRKLHSFKTLSFGEESEVLKDIQLEKQNSNVSSDQDNKKQIIQQQNKKPLSQSQNQLQNISEDDREVSQESEIIDSEELSKRESQNQKRADGKEKVRNASLVLYQLERQSSFNQLENSNNFNKLQDQSEYFQYQSKNVQRDQIQKNVSQYEAYQEAKTLKKPIFKSKKDLSQSDSIYSDFGKLQQKSPEISISSNENNQIDSNANQIREFPFKLSLINDQTNLEQEKQIKSPEFGRITNHERRFKKQQYKGRLKHSQPSQINQALKLRIKGIKKKNSDTQLDQGGQEIKQKSEGSGVQGRLQSQSDQLFKTSLYSGNQIFNQSVDKIE